MDVENESGQSLSEAAKGKPEEERQEEVRALVSAVSEGFVEVAHIG